jgi:hypothetical protein
MASAEITAAVRGNALTHPGKTKAKNNGTNGTATGKNRPVIASIIRLSLPTDQFP